MENIDKLKNIAETGRFNGYFRTSAKTGLNISESMEFLIIEIIKKMEDLLSKGNEELTNERESLKINPDNHNKEVDEKRKGCCK